jgi:hypothetical protein
MALGANVRMRFLHEWPRFGERQRGDFNVHLHRNAEAAALAWSNGGTAGNNGASHILRPNATGAPEGSQKRETINADLLAFLKS